MSLVTRPVPSGGFATLIVWSTRVVHGVCRDRKTKRPLSKHPVHVAVPTGDGRNIDETRTLRLSTLTDAEGRYRVRVPLGTWVKVRTAGSGCLDECTVHGKEENDFAVGVGPPLCNGKVVDHSGRPCGQAIVLDANDPRIRCRTDAGGGFLLRPKAVHQQHRWVHVFASGQPPKAFHLASPNKPAGVLAVPAGNRIRLRLVDASGKPLANRSVVVGGHARTSALAGQRITSYELRTDATGAFAAHVPKGCVYLSAFVQHEDRYVWFFSGAPQAGGDIGNLTIAPAFEVRGRVIYGTRLPAARLRIRLMRLPDDGSTPDVSIGRRKVRLPALERWTDRGGRFALPSLLAGRYEVAFMAEHHGPVVRRFRLPLGKDDGKRIRNRQLWFELAPRNPIRGVVVDRAGAPVPGATVTGHPQVRHAAGMQSAMWRFGLSSQLRTVTDQKGRFSLFVNERKTTVVVNAHRRDKAKWVWTNPVQVTARSPRTIRLVMR